MQIFNKEGNEGKILKDLVALRRKIGGFQAKKIAGGPQYPVKNMKDLMIKLREAADELEMPMAGSPVAQTVITEPTERGSKVTLTTTVRYMSSDGTWVDFVGTGGGMAPDDKGAGKAHTYSAKVASVLGLILPDAEIEDTDDNELRPIVHEIIEKLNSSTTLEALRAHKSSLEKLTEYEKSFVMPVYIKLAAKFSK